MNVTLPPTGTTWFVGAIYKRPVGNGKAVIQIAFLHSNLSLARPVYSAPASSPEKRLVPRADSTSERVAWTELEGLPQPMVYLKAVNGRSTDLPFAIGGQYKGAYFCDWTEQDELLCNVTSNGTDWKLVILDTNGLLKREMPTPPTGEVQRSWFGGNARTEAGMDEFFTWLGPANTPFLTRAAISSPPFHLHPL